MSIKCTTPLSNSRFGFAASTHCSCLKGPPCLVVCKKFTRGKKTVFYIGVVTMNSTASKNNRLLTVLEIHTMTASGCCFSSR